MKEYKLIDLSEAAKLIEALVLLEQFLLEIRAAIIVLEEFKELDDLDGHH